VAAIQQFCRESLDLIIEEFPSAVVNIVGAGPAASVAALGRNPHVNVVGFVPELRDAYAGAHVLIAPMPFVAGVQNKVLEALASGIPAVVTRFANEGVRASAAEGVLVVEEMSGFAAGVNRVLSEYQDWHRRAQTNGRRFVTERFRWGLAADRVRDIAREAEATSSPTETQPLELGKRLE
jgi:glycosyltransferase involved in cell wall biosynthesis